MKEGMWGKKGKCAGKKPKKRGGPSGLWKRNGKERKPEWER